MSGFLWRMGGALSVAILGLAMLFYSLERLSLVQLAKTMGQGDGHAPFAVVTSLFIGLVLLNFSVFYALIRWADFLRDNPATSQAPVWLLFVVIVIAGGGLVLAMATHAGYLRTLATVPMDVNWGYLSFQIVAAALALIPLVLLGVRWSPGYKRRLSQV